MLRASEMQTQIYIPKHVQWESRGLKDLLGVTRTRSHLVSDFVYLSIRQLESR